jgi:hypothetical protein
MRLLLLSGFWSGEEGGTHSAIEKKKMKWPARRECDQGGLPSTIPSQEKNGEYEGALPP